MYLKELGLNGFKSFPDKVKLEFNRGITAVVGPNGSGKSNISDAVRWVLGEQRVKNLRGDKMEDVIFSGTDSRRPIGFAEVSLTLDNEDGMIPLNYSEITVKRTVFRSGESKYTINGTPCRLKDINELFMDTGVGREGYSIIGQGRIDEILSTKSEDRRRLFEEAAGIAKYRSRRLEAINKLAKEQENLLRIDDIVTEIESVIEPLKEQSENAKKYLLIREELKKCDIGVFFVKADKFEGDLAKNESDRDITNKDIEENESRYNELSDLSKQYKEEEKKLSDYCQELNDTISRNTSDYQETNGKISLIEEQINNTGEKIKNTESGFKTAGLKAEKLKNDISIFESKKTAFDVKLNELYSNLEKKENEFNEFSRKLNEGEEKLNQFKSDIFEKMRSSAELKTDIENSRMRLKQLTDKKTDISNSISVSEGKLQQANVHVLSVKKRIAENDESAKKYNNILESLKKEQQSIKEKLFITEKKHKETSSKFAEALSRYKVLREMKNDFEGYYRSVKAVLKEGQRGTLKGIHGAVGELIKTDAKYETAVETALGSAVQNIVTDDEYSAKTAIEYLKRGSLGRATFMPVNVIAGREIDEKNRILDYVGVCGIASDIVEYDKKYNGIIVNLLGRVIIAENMDYAIKISQSTGRKYRIVTLDGDIINPGGAMTGGSSAKKQTGIFGRNREISELETLCRKLKADMEEYAEETADLRESAGETDSGINDTILVIHKFELEKASLSDELKKAEESLAEIEQVAKNNTSEREFVEKSIKETNDNINNLESRLAEIEADIKNTDKELQSFRSFVESGRGERDRLINDITSLKVSISSDEQEKNGINENLLRLKDELKETENENRDFSALKAEYEKELEEKKNELRLSKSKIIELTELKAENEEKLKEYTAKKCRLSEEYEKTQALIKESYEIISGLKNTLFKYDTNIESLKSEREKLYSTMWDEYEVTYNEAKEMYSGEESFAELEKRSRKLRGQIRELGPVNVGAIDEYSKMKERYDFLTSQRDDIRKAEDNLLKVVDDLENLMKEQFSSQFGKISENFNEVFREMFGGGKAYLKLSDSSDILESGIDIIAQPPGKTMQNMMLLSGGERALTAIAILFAILKMKPSPFCILDEIEAALDDANVKRFSDYLRRFSQTTQFIVISHRKGTMEAADVLYGVTMQEKGISKVISVKFEDIKDKEV